MAKIVDRLLKSLAVDDPRALYHLLSELLPPKLSQLDYWCVFRAGNQRRAGVFEFKGKYESGMQHQLLRHAMATSVATDLAVRATLMEVSGKKFPKDYREIESIDCAGVRMEFSNVAAVGDRPAVVAGAVHEAHVGELVDALRRIPRVAQDALDTLDRLVRASSSEEALVIVADLIRS